MIAMKDKTETLASLGLMLRASQAARERMADALHEEGLDAAADTLLRLGRLTVFGGDDEDWFRLGVAEAELEAAREECGAVIDEPLDFLRAFMTVAERGGLPVLREHAPGHRGIVRVPLAGVERPARFRVDEQGELSLAFYGVTLHRVAYRFLFLTAPQA